MKSIKYLILSIFLCCLNPFVLTQDAEHILEANKPALVSIWTFEDAAYNYITEEYSFDTLVFLGSGFFINKEGSAGTCYHVVSRLDTIIVKTADGIFFPAKVITADTVNDLALVKVDCEADKSFPFITMGNSDDLKTGEPICAIGNPLGYEYSISQGIISGIRDNAIEHFDNKEIIFDRVIQTDAAISPGNSGGAFFNSKGEVIGITSYHYLSLGNLNFGVAINCFKKLIEQDNSEPINKNAESHEQIEDKIENYLEIANSLKQKIRKYYVINDSLNQNLHAKPSPIKGDSSELNINQDSLDNIYMLKVEYFYNKCLKLDSAYFNTYDDMIDYYIKIKNPVKAEEVYRNAQTMFPEDSKLVYLSNSLEEYYLRYKEFSKIRKLYGISDCDKEVKADALYKLGLLYEKMGDADAALKQYWLTVKKDPKFFRALFQIGKYNYKLGYYSKAKKYFESVCEIKLMPNSSRINSRFEFREDTYSDFELNYYLGMISAREGNKWEALINYLKLNPSDTEESEMSLKLYRKIVK